MGYPSADDVERLSDAVATKSAIEEVEYRQNHGSARAYGSSRGAKFVGNVPLRSNDGGWFAKKALASGYNLTVASDLAEGTLVEYQNESKNYYGKIVKSGGSGAVAEEISVSEAEKIKKEGKAMVVVLGKRNLTRKESNNLFTKIIDGFWGFLFPSNDDSVDAFLMTFVRLVLLVLLVMVLSFLAASVF